MDGVVWNKLYSKSGKVIYEGYTLYGKPYGAGTSYYANGNKCREGVFDIKGLVFGREYYPNGQVRFEGSFEINHGYGPNYPVYGTLFDEEGNELYRGRISVIKSSIGYPMVTLPEDFGPVPLPHTPELEYIIWQET